MFGNECRQGSFIYLVISYKSESRGHIFGCHFPAGLNAAG